MEQKKQGKSKQIHWPLIIRDLLRNAWLVILAGIIGIMGVFCYNGLLHTPEYTSTVTFAVSPRTNGSYVGFYTSLRTASQMAEVFKEVFSSDVLKRMVKEDIADPDLEVKVESTLEEGTNILKVSAKAEDPLLAHRIMDSVLRNYDKVSEYMFGNVVLDTIKSPHVPTEPSNPLNMKLWCCVAAVLAMGGMGGGILLLSMNRATVKTIQGAKETMGESPIGVLIREKSALPGRKQKRKGLLISMTSVSFRYVEGLLRVAHKIRHRMKKEQKQVLLITSVAENEGKSTLAANLALAMVKHGSKVALVDMDLRRPAMHKLFSEAGPQLDLMAVLDGKQELAPEKDLYVFTVQQGCANAGQLLHDPKLGAFLEELRRKVDYVILDSAPYMAVADTGMLLRYADGCIMSVRQDWVPHKVLRAVSEELDQDRAQYMGYVLNYYVDDGTLHQHNKQYEKYQ